MTHVDFLLTGGPFDSERWRTAYELGRAALDFGHEGCSSPKTINTGRSAAVPHLANNTVYEYRVS